MLTIKRANIFHTIKLYQILNKLIYDEKFFRSLDFYSKYEGRLFLQIFFGNVYMIFDKTDVKGFIVIDTKDNRLYFIPDSNDISIFKLVHLIKRSIGLSGFDITLNYKNLNIDLLKQHFEIEVTENLMFMSIEEDFVSNAPMDNRALLTRKLVISKEECLRAELQNSIFSNIKNRTPLTLNDILYEEGSSKFLNDFCFILEEFRVPIGYGQILKFNNHYFLVNFGIIEEYRKRGYGYHFLYHIIKQCFKQGIQRLYLSVEKSNNSAITLYKSMGFQQVHDSITLNFK